MCEKKAGRKRERKRERERERETKLARSQKKPY